MTYCPKCEKENEPEAPFCSSCGAELHNSSEKTDQPKEQGVKEAGLSALYEKIDSLSDSDKVKDQLRKFADAMPSGNKEGYEKLHFSDKFNWWALIFGFLYYAYKGLWKKGILYFAIYIIFGSIINGITDSSIGGTLIVLAISAWFGMTANYDYYSMKVLGKNRWL